MEFDGIFGNAKLQGEFHLTVINKLANISSVLNEVTSIAVLLLGAEEFLEGRVFIDDSVTGLKFAKTHEERHFGICGQEVFINFEGYFVGERGIKRFSGVKLRI